MSTNFPGSLDNNTTLPNPGSGNATNSPSHAGQHDNENDAIKAIEAKLGIGASTATVGKVLRGTGGGTSAWGQIDVTTDVAGFTSANLRALVSDETGTGVLVFATSPTLITPTLTSPVIGNFSSAQHDHTNAAGGGQLTTGAYGNNTVTGIKLGQAATCSLYKTANQTVTTNTISRITWDAELYDTIALHSTVTNNSRITIPTGYAGIWRATINMGEVGAIGAHHVALYLNGAIVKLARYDSGGGGAVAGMYTMSYEINLAVGDYLEAWVYLTGTTVNGGGAYGQDYSTMQATFVGTT